MTDHSNHPLIQEIDQLLSDYPWDWWYDECGEPPHTAHLKQLLLKIGGRNNKHYHRALLAVWRKHTDRPFRVGKIRVASDVRAGEWFSKTETAYQYTRISDSAAGFYNMAPSTREEDRTPEKCIFGVSLEGGTLTDVYHDRIVWTRGFVTDTVLGPQGWEKVDRAEYDPFCGYAEGADLSGYGK